MKQTTIRIITGIIITAVGVCALLGALNILDFWSWFNNWWPTLVIAGGVLTLVGDFRRNYLWGGVLVIVGTLLLLKSHGVLDFNLFGLIVPLFIIAAGLSVLLQTNKRVPTKSSSGDHDDIAVMFSGSDTKNKSKDYQGGKITTVFGGTVLDLRDAKISDSATLDLFVICGGVELKVPRDWKVISKITPIAGGVENKSEGSDDAKTPTLVLTGVVTFAGVEIKT